MAAQGNRIEIETFLFVNIGVTGIYDREDGLSNVKLIVIPRSREEVLRGSDDEVDYDYHAFEFSPVEGYESGRSLLTYNLTFPIAEYERLTAFIQSYQNPVALISYAGFTFHYRILKRAIEGFSGLPSGLLCADLMQGIYELENAFGPQQPRDSGLLPWEFRGSEGEFRRYQFSAMFEGTVEYESGVDESVVNRSPADNDAGLPLPKLKALVEWTTSYRQVHNWLRLRSSYDLFDSIFSNNA